jgi:MoaD family protein
MPQEYEHEGMPTHNITVFFSRLYSESRAIDYYNFILPLQPTERIRGLPITPERVLTEIKRAKMPSPHPQTQVAHVTVRLYTTLRAIAGEDEVQVEALNVQDALTMLAKKYGPEFKDSLFGSQNNIDLRFYRIFVNKEVLTPETGLLKRLQDNGLIQIFPPVVGG